MDRGKRKPTDFTVNELKEKLRSMGLPSTGNKNELISNLMTADPSGDWMLDDRPSAENWEETRSEHATTESERDRDERALLRREMEIARREREIAERELALARNEIEMLRRMQTASAMHSPNVREDNRRASATEVRDLSLREITELVGHFDGKAEDINLWLDQVQYLQATYHLTDDQLRVMIAQRLKGKALDWFRSSREYLYMEIQQLLLEMKKMFYQRTSKLSSRTKFQERTWQRDETFSDYYHDKVMLARQTLIDEEEMIEFVIEGIPDRMLRDQARVHDHKKKESLLSAFEHISLEGRTLQTKTDVAPARQEKNKKSDKKISNATKDFVRCKNCGAKSHPYENCPYKDKGAKCFQCQEFGHIAASCPKKRVDVKESCSISRWARGKLYKNATIGGKEIPALIDTGSDISLMRAGQYSNLRLPTLKPSEITFRGIGSEENKTLGEFSTEIEIDGNVYDIVISVVPDTLMRHDFLIGTDFLDTVNIVIKEGNVRVEKPMNEERDNNWVAEILNIDCVCESQCLDLSHVSEDRHRSALKDIVENYKPAKTREVGIEMKIVLKDDEPVYQRPRRLPPAEREEVNKHVSQWLRDGIIQPSLSDYASPVVLVKKKDGNTRLCIDYRKLNDKIVKDRFPLPLIDDQLDALQDANVFSTLDLRNGFFHVPIEPGSRKYTAFVVSDGQYEFLYVPFGLCNSPAVFQRFINAVFKELINKNIVLTYMDDLVIPSKDRDTGIVHLREVIRVAEEYGLDIKWEKCNLLNTKVEFLGHVIENGTIRPSERKTDAVMKFVEPKNVKQLQSFLGLTGYFRKFIAKYSVIARPLTDLLKANMKFEIGDSQRLAIEQLKCILSTNPLLKIYRTGAETELHTDASMHGFGAILLQRDKSDNRFHPVYYASGKTTDAESKYSSYELEVLAIVKALRKFRVYLLGVPFRIVTDCQAFAMTMRKKDLCVRVARWVLLLEEFNYTIEHRPGKNLPHVDALSRNPLPSIMLIEESEESVNVRIGKAQREDCELKGLFELAQKDEQSDYHVKYGLLFKTDDGEMRLVVPKAMISQIIKRVHECGHFSIAKTETLIKRNYWFPNMRAKIQKVVQNCVSCILAERKHGRQEGFLNPIEKGSVPLDVYHVDHLGPLASTKKSYRHILVVVDAFCKFVWLYAVRSTSTAEVLDKLRKQAEIFGHPRRIISDRGTAFSSHEFAEYCKKEGIEHVMTTTGVPRGNGQVERINRTLIPVLTKLATPNAQEWFKHLKTVQRFLNATPNRSIGLSPFEILFGVRMRQKDDPDISELIEREWVDTFSQNRDELRNNAREQLLKVQQENLRTYNRRRKKAQQYGEDDLVAIKRTQLGPGLKLAGKYLGPYQIVKVLRNDRYLVRKIGEQEGPLQTSTSADHMKPWIEGDSDCGNDDECTSE